MRPSELCGLRVGRLHLVKGSVEVVEALTVVHGHTEVGPIKNGVRRTVLLTASVRDELATLLASRTAGLGRPLEADDLVFVAPKGGALRRDLLHKRIVQPAAIAAGLPSTLRVHDLRHTCASLLIALGAHPKVIQEVLGHRSITITMDVYGHLFPTLNAELNGRLNAVLADARSAAEQGEALMLPFARVDAAAARPRFRVTGPR